MTKARTLALEAAFAALSAHFGAVLIVVEHPHGSNSKWSGSASTGLGLTELAKLHVASSLNTPHIEELPQVAA